MRTPLIVGNWKMNKTASEAVSFARELLQASFPTPAVEVVVAPPFVALGAVQAVLGPSAPISLGAQNVHWEDHGAYTGEVSAPMLKDLGCRYVILGHSERRALCGESNEIVLKKITAALRHGLSPILCVGESLLERESGRTLDVITRQTTACLQGLTESQLATLTIAYEPVWAIGTGKAATPAQAEEIHQLIRRVLTSSWSSDLAARTRILYGGSVTAQNASGFLSVPDIDGALVGGACLQTESFATIAGYAHQ